MSEAARGVSRSAFSYFSGTLLSRVSGMIRDMTMAFCFGASGPLAAFLVAYRLVYLLRRLLGEGLFHQGFIPHLEAKRKLDPKVGAKFYRDLFATLSLTLVAVIGVCELALFLFDGEISHLTRLMLPGVFFLCLFALNTALLQAEKSFFLPSVSPLAFNGCWILGVFALRNVPIETAITHLALILTLAFFVQVAMTLPKAWLFLRSHLSIGEVLRPRPFSPELRVLIQPLLLGVLGSAAIQINSAVDALFARFSAPEGPAYLWYAIRLQQLPLALFGIALASALLPSLSRAVDDAKQFNHLLAFTLKRAFTLIFPCVIGIFVLGFPSINLLFGRGDFSLVATQKTAACLYAYGIGLLPAALVQVLAPAFYAKKDYRTPALAFAYSAAVNLFFNTLLVFVFKLGATSIALATSAAAFFNVAYLFRSLRPKIGDISHYVYVSVAAMVAGGIAFLSRGLLPAEVPRALTEQLLHFALPTALFFSVFLLLCRRLKVRLFS